LHDLRHTHVGWLIDDKWDFYSIQRRIGHESIRTTFDVYGHRLPHGDKEGLKALDERLEGRRGKTRKKKGTAAKKGKKGTGPGDGVSGLSDAA